MLSFSKIYAGLVVGFMEPRSRFESMQLRHLHPDDNVLESHHWRPCIAHFYDQRKIECKLRIAYIGLVTR
jgi:hypothetical protein